MSGTAANTTNDVSSEVSLLRTVVFAVTDTTTILAYLIFVVTEGTIESSKLAELIAFMIILTFWSRRSLKTLISNVFESIYRTYIPFQ